MVTNKALSSNEDFEKKLAWKTAKDFYSWLLGNEIKFPEDQEFVNKLYFRQAAAQQMSYIAEGFGRLERKDKFASFQVALGANSVAKSYLIFCKDQNYLKSNSVYVLQISKLDLIKKEVKKIIDEIGYTLTEHYENKKGGQ